ncbi:hypothetical protein AWZ03_015109, partial [Drosophila navojoa]
DHMDHKEPEGHMAQLAHNAYSMALVHRDNKVRTQVIRKGREVSKVHTVHKDHMVHFPMDHSPFHTDHMVRHKFLHRVHMVHMVHYALVQTEHHALVHKVHNEFHTLDIDL